MQFEFPVILIVGAMKSATTTVYADLSAQAAILAPALKEPYILVGNESVPEMVAAYETYFGRKGAETFGLDASTGYTMRPDYPDAASRAKVVLKSVPLILYVIREPFGRIVSHHLHSVASGDMDPDIGTALEHDHRLMSYGDYGYQIQPWVETFGRERVWVITTDYLMENRLEVARSIFEFLEMDYDLDRIDPDYRANPADRTYLPSGFVRFFRGSFGSAGYRLLYRVTNRQMRQAALRVLRRRSPPPEKAALTGAQIESIWERLSPGFGDVVPLIRHPVSDSRTIWNRKALMNRYPIHV